MCFAMLAAAFIPISAEQTSKEVYVGGCLFGLKAQTNGVVVVGITKVESTGGSISPSAKAGLKQNDVIISINGNNVSSTKDVTEAITGCNGMGLSMLILRDGNQHSISLTPLLCTDGKYRAGIWIRDSAAGIGTVTFIDPKTLEFSGLGHGICDADTGKLLPISRGIVTDVQLSEIIKGSKGAPGEIKGSFTGGKKGALLSNKTTGVQGIYSTLPSGIFQLMKTASLNEVAVGEAYIRTAVSGEIRDYKIRIDKIQNADSLGKNFIIRILDSDLISLTGGIVQGMSGSPIIQNGKLVGAVTHVTVNDPTKGYGIFIGNMLN